MKDNFKEFINQLADYTNSNHPNICFFGYGSCFNGWTNNPKDIDGGFIVNNIITDKKEISALSKNLAVFLYKNDLEPSDVQFNLIDLETAVDGRFLSFGKSYISYFPKHAIIISGENYLDKINGIEYKRDNLSSAAFNFRKVRNSFLFSEYNKQYDKRKFAETFSASLSALLSLPKQLKEIKEGTLEVNKIKVWNEQENLTGIDHNFIDISIQLRDKNNFRNFVDNHDITPYFSYNLGLYEKLIKNYIEQNPPKKITVETIV